MKTIGKFRVRESLTELADPSVTVVLIVDLQNDFCHPDGSYARAGKDLNLIRDMLPRAVSFVREAQSLGVRCVFVRQITLPSGRSDSPAWSRFKTRDGKSPHYALLGSWGADFVGDLIPAKCDLVVEKLRPDGFHGTPLDLLLRANDVESVLVMGVLTEGCVESTVRSASYHDYYTLVIEDCVASCNLSCHEGSMNLFRMRYTMVTSEKLLRCWRNAPAT